MPWRYPQTCGVSSPACLRRERSGGVDLGVGASRSGVGGVQVVLVAVAPPLGRLGSLVFIVLSLAGLLLPVREFFRTGIVTSAS